MACYATSFCALSLLKYEESKNRTEEKKTEGKRKRTNNKCYSCTGARQKEAQIWGRARASNRHNLFECQTTVNRLHLFCDFLFQIERTEHNSQDRTIQRWGGPFFLAKFSTGNSGILFFLEIFNSSFQKEHLVRKNITIRCQCQNCYAHFISCKRCKCNFEKNRARQRSNFKVKCPRIKCEYNKIYKLHQVTNWIEHTLLSSALLLSSYFLLETKLGQKWNKRPKTLSFPISKESFCIVLIQLK